MVSVVRKSVQKAQISNKIQTSMQSCMKWMNTDRIQMNVHS